MRQSVWNASTGLVLRSPERGRAARRGGRPGLEPCARPGPVADGRAVRRAWPIGAGPLPQAHRRVVVRHDRGRRLPDRRAPRLPPHGEGRVAVLAPARAPRGGRGLVPQRVLVAVARLGWRALAAPQPGPRRHQLRAGAPGHPRVLARRRDRPRRQRPGPGVARGTRAPEAGRPTGRAQRRHAARHPSGPGAALGQDRWGAGPSLRGAAPPAWRRGPGRAGAASRACGVRPSRAPCTRAGRCCAPAPATRVPGARAARAPPASWGHTRGPPRRDPARVQGGTARPPGRRAPRSSPRGRSGLRPRGGSRPPGRGPAPAAPPGGHASGPAGRPAPRGPPIPGAP